MQQTDMEALPDSAARVRSSAHAEALAATSRPRGMSSLLEKRKTSDVVSAWPDKGASKHDGKKHSALLRAQSSSLATATAAGAGKFLAAIQNKTSKATAQPDRRSGHLRPQLSMDLRRRSGVRETTGNGMHGDGPASESVLSKLVANQMVTESGEVLRGANGMRVLYDDEGAAEPLNRSKWWRVSAETVRMSVLEHLARSQARDVVNEQLRTWADDKVKQYGKDVIASLDLVDLEQMDSDDEDSKPQPMGFASDIKRCWEQRINAEVDGRLEAAREIWAQDVQVELQRVRELAEMVTQLEREVLEESAIARGLEGQLSSAKLECQRLRFERENDRKTFEREAAKAATEFEELKAQMLAQKGAVSSLGGLAIGPEDLQKMEDALEAEKRETRRLQQQLEASEPLLKKKDAELAAMEEQLRLVKAQLQAKGGKQGAGGAKGADDVGQLKKELESTKKDLFAKLQEAAKWRFEAEKLQKAAGAAPKAAKDSEGKGGAKGKPAAARPQPSVPQPDLERLKKQIASLEVDLRGSETAKRQLQSEIEQLKSNATTLKRQVATLEDQAKALAAQTLQPTEATRPAALNGANAARSMQERTPEDSATADLDRTDVDASAQTVKQEASQTEDMEMFPPAAVMLTTTASQTDVNEGSDSVRHNASGRSSHGDSDPGPLQTLPPTAHRSQAQQTYHDGAMQLVRDIVKCVTAELRNLHSETSGAVGMDGTGSHPQSAEDFASNMQRRILHAVSTYLAALIQSPNANESGALTAEDLGALSAALNTIKSAASTMPGDTWGADGPESSSQQARSRRQPLSARTRMLHQLEQDSQHVIYSGLSGTSALPDKNSMQRFVDTFTPWTVAATVDDLVKGATQTTESHDLGFFTIASYTTAGKRPSSAYAALSNAPPPPPHVHFRAGFQPFAPSQLVSPGQAQKGRARSASRSRSPPKDSRSEYRTGEFGQPSVAVHHMQLEPIGAAPPEGRAFLSRRLAVANPQKGFRAGQYAGRVDEDDVEEDASFSAPGQALGTETRLIDPMAAAHMRPTRGIQLARLDVRAPESSIPYNHYRFLQQQKADITKLYYKALKDCMEQEKAVEQLQRELATAKSEGENVLREKQQLQDELVDMQRQMFHIVASPPT